MKVSIEIWKDIPGYEGFYKLDREGNVMSLERTYVDSNGVRRTNKARILKQENTIIDCPRVTLFKDGSYEKIKCKELAEKLFNGNN